jgi:hypothetical protein
MSTNSRGSNPKGSANKFDKSGGGGWSPPSGSNSQHPPAAGSHKPADTHRIDGGHGAGKQAPGVHESLRKPNLFN